MKKPTAAPARTRAGTTWDAAAPADGSPWN